MMKRERVTAAWADADDDTPQKTTKVLTRATPKWAMKRDEELFNDSDSEFESFLASTSVANALKRFTHEGLRMRRRADLNIDARSAAGPIQSVSWQRLGKSSMEKDPLVAFASRTDKEVRLCRITENGKESQIEFSLKLKGQLSPKVVHFISAEELLITSSIANGRVMLYNVATDHHQIFSTFGGRRITQARHIENSHTESVFSIAYDEGRILTVDKRSKQLVAENRLNNTCVGLSWTADGSMYAGDSRANIYKFDSRMSSKCMFRDQLSSITSMTSFTANASGLLACGSPFGTVDVVDGSSLGRDQSVSVVSSFDRLVTEVTRTAFHPIVNSLLLVSSAEKKNAVRVFECESGKTMAGWPTEQEPLGRILDSSFSDCGRFVAFGCKSGRVQMYALEQ